MDAKTYREQGGGQSGSSARSGGGQSGSRDKVGSIAVIPVRIAVYPLFQRKEPCASAVKDITSARRHPRRRAAFPEDEAVVEIVARRYRREAEYAHKVNQKIRQEACGFGCHRRRGNDNDSCHRHEKLVLCTHGGGEHKCGQYRKNDSCPEKGGVHFQHFRGRPAHYLIFIVNEKSRRIEQSAVELQHHVIPEIQRTDVYLLPVYPDDADTRRSHTAVHENRREQHCEHIYEHRSADRDTHRYHDIPPEPVQLAENGYERTGHQAQKSKPYPHQQYGRRLIREIIFMKNFLIVYFYLFFHCFLSVYLCITV